MNQTELLADLLRGSLEMLKGTLSDFSDADMFVRPCPGANHAAWQLGHLTNSELNAASTVSGAAPEFPAGYTEKFKKETASNDDQNFFPPKSELLSNFIKAREATIALAKSLKPADLEKPTPEKYKSWAPTNGHLLGILPGHGAMHVGQFQVIRRKLGKPVLF